MDTLDLLRTKLAFNDWANRRALQSLRGMAKPSSRATRALSHILLVERLWLSRLRREDPGKAPAEFFPELPLSECELLIEETLKNYGVYFDGLSEQELDIVGDYQTLAGSNYTASKRDVLNHVMMHSMYHRGQVALATREDGGEPQQSDYILFVRETSAKSAAS